MNEIVARIPTNRQTEQVYVGMFDYEGKRRIHLRVFYKKDGEWKATPRGISLPPERIGELVEAVTALEKAVGKGPAQ